MKSPVIKRSIVIAGHKTSVSLEDAFWQGLKEIADEIIVVDSGSTDDTVTIAESFGAKVYPEPWKGFARQKNSSLAKATCDWILSLDADESVTPELAASIKKLLKPGATPEFSGRDRIEQSEREGCSTRQDIQGGVFLFRAEFVEVRDQGIRQFWRLVAADNRNRAACDKSRLSGSTSIARPTGFDDCR